MPDQTDNPSQTDDLEPQEAAQEPALSLVDDHDTQEDGPPVEAHRLPEGWVLVALPAFPGPPVTTPGMDPREIDTEWRRRRAQAAQEALGVVEERYGIHLVAKANLFIDTN